MWYACCSYLCGMLLVSFSVLSSLFVVASSSVIDAEWTPSERSIHSFYRCMICYFSIYNFVYFPFGSECRFKTNRKAMNRNWSNQKANPALKTKREINKIYKLTKYNENKLLTERAAISQKVATQQPKLN